MLELHCEVCANAGGRTRVSQDTLIATFKPENVKLPLDGSMFDSPIPSRGVPPPWLAGAKWLDMFCPRGRTHLPWWGVADEAIMADFRSNGGPAHLLTNRGTFTLTEDGIEEEEFKHQQSEDELEDEWFARIRESMSSADTELEFILEKRKEGLSYKRIGEILGKSKDTIARRVRGRKKQ